jgi:hypothetical protein
MNYSIDQYGVIRLGDAIVPMIESSQQYQAYLSWLMQGGELTTIVSKALLPDLGEYKAKQYEKLLAIANEYVKGFTANMLECEVQSFPTLINQARAFKEGKQGDEIIQITIQAQLTNNTPEQVVENILKRERQLIYSTPVMSSLRQNAFIAVQACSTHEQVDAVVELLKQRGKAMVDTMIQSVLS